MKLISRIGRWRGDAAGAVSSVATGSLAIKASSRWARVVPRHCIGGGRRIGRPPETSSDVGAQEFAQRADREALAIRHRGQRDILVELHRLAHRGAERHLLELALFV